MSVNHYSINGFIIFVYCTNENMQQAGLPCSNVSELKYYIIKKFCTFLTTKYKNLVIYSLYFFIHCKIVEESCVTFSRICSKDSKL